MIDNQPDLSWFKFQIKRSSQLISQVASSGVSLTQDDVADGINAKQFTAIEKTKLASITSPYLAKGAWDASTGLFPANTFTGWTYVVSVDGVVDGVDFKVSDTISSLVDNALTTTYASNWLKEDNTATSDLLKADKILNTLAIEDLATGGAIGTAAATVDLYEKFNVNQTTADQTVTIPSPTLSTNKKLIYVENIGSKSFSLYDLDLKPSTIRVLYFNGADWIVVNSEDGGGDAKLNPLAITDLATGGAIGTALATVDTYNKFNINQTTASQTITIPNPTLTTEEKLIYVENVGSKSFSLYGTDLKPLSIRILVFNGTAWITAGGGGGGAKLNPLAITNLATGGAIGTAVATVDIYNKFNVNQTTADQTVTIPSPTVTTEEKLIYVENIGSESFSLYDIDVKPLSIRILVFNGTAWITAGGGGEDDNKADKVLNSLDVANLATGGSIGTAITTVDLYEKFNINQTTADQTITVPNPTISTNEKQITVANTGSKSFNIFGIDLLVDTFIECIFHSTKGWIQPSASMEIFEGASSSNNGTSGLVPVPPAGSENKFLRGSGFFDNIAAVALPEYARPLFGDSIVFEDVSQAVSAGVLTYQSGSSTNSWAGATVLQGSYSNTSSGTGHIVTVPAGYNTIWIRVVGDRNCVFEVDRFDGANYVTFGRRQYSKTDGIIRTVAPYGVAAGPNISGYRHHTWLMFNCPDSFGGQYKIRPTSYIPAGSIATSDYGVFMSGLVISKNDTGFAYTTAMEQHWSTQKVVTPLLNGASWSYPPPAFSAIAVDADCIDVHITNRPVDIPLPQCANGKDKLFFMSLYADNPFSAPHRAWVNNIEIFSQDLPGGKYLKYLNMNNSPVFDVYSQILRARTRLIGFRIPASVMGIHPFSHLRLDWTGALDIVFFQDCGTIDIEQ